MSKTGDQDYNLLAEPEVIRLAQQGDRRAYDLLVRRYQKQVYRWAFHVVRIDCAHGALDILCSCRDLGDRRPRR